ncbi:MAG: hypothetical protein SNJ82_06315 [Gemmataceae bacterium]
MIRLLSLALVFAIVGVVLAQDKDTPKKDKPTEPDKKYKGILPANFKKLGLTDAQVQAIYKLQSEYRDKMDRLKKQMETLKTEERAAIEKVLTDVQLKRLKEIRSGDKK